jgi:hypothetical protein
VELHLSLRERSRGIERVREPASSWRKALTAR